MQRKTLKRTSALLTAPIAAAALLFLTGCGGAASVDTAAEQDFYGTTVSFHQDLADRVPEEWKSGITVPAKVLQPNAFVDEDGAVVGMQPDLVEAFSALWGIPITVESVAFDGHVPGVMAEKYAFTVSTGDHEKRREVMDMVDYSAAGVAWLTQADSDLTSKDDICGHVIGVIKGTDQEERAHEKAEACAAQGIEGTEAIGFSNTLISVPLQAERIDVAYDSLAQMVYFAENQSDEFRLVGDPEPGVTLALGVKAGEQEKVDLLQDSLQELMDSGAYEAIFAEWGLSDLMLDRAYVNGQDFSPEVQELVHIPQ
ncbi:transporter substrate-binding domain-containing protein [Citricoccus sp. NPDC055426]|uniref:transporter substrate-binding domain-containing protein n=1 Tax=Citricoccus sp. NPDC055426 TaxID=3155536 RepID=UPI0034244543